MTWLWVLLSGLALFFATDWALNMTANPRYLPTVILVGATVVPVTFVVYIYERLPAREIPVPSLVIASLWGGTLGLVVAGVLEYQTARQLGVLPMVGIGLIEESAKLILPVIIFLRGRFRSESDGLVFGVAAGMGFAALETMGYGFTVLLQTRGDVSTLHQTLFIRGLLSPAGHAAWTGLVCAVLWRERKQRGHVILNWAIVWAFALAVLLHALWNIFGSISILTGAGVFLFDLIGLVIVGGVSLWLLLRRLHEAAQEKMSEANTPEIL
ncbi:MAG: PrsW family intramembrane metalloprotease [Chloroflexi bacterium]|nr:PrsW family intramembrane metalloprotease [Chloroflexota bacterium]